MIKNIAMATLILGASIFAPGATEAKTTSSQTTAKYCTQIKMVNGKIYRDVFYMYGGDKYHYFLDPAAEPGNNVYAVHRDSLGRWGVNVMQLGMGQQMTGVYDKTGRDLLKVKR